MICPHTNMKGEAQASLSLSSTPSFAYAPFLLLFADYCQHLASARKRSILASELAAYSIHGTNDDDTRATTRRKTGGGRYAPFSFF